MTDESRRKQIEKALAAREERDSAERPSHPLPWRGGERHFPVIDLPLDTPLLNADSHRIRAELEAPALEFVRKERTTEHAQAKLTELWKKAHRKFDRLKESLLVDGQTEAGVVTRAGVLINGNTRLVALRELQLPDRQFIRVAVLESDATPFEIAQLELRLQVRDPVRDPYRLSSELLFIEELRRVYSTTDEQIAIALGWNPSRPALGKARVEHYQRILQLIREMQRRNPSLPITFFDDERGGPGKLQQLKELEQRYDDLNKDGQVQEAGLLLDTWLVVARSGFSSVHQIRSVTRGEGFLSDYLLPRLGEQDLIGERAEELVRQPAPTSATLPGLDDLDPGGIAEGGPHYDLGRLVRIVESHDDEPVSLTDSVQIDAQGAKEAVRAAIDGAIRDYRAEDRAEDALNAPVDGLRKAGRELKRVIDAYADLRGTKEFERQARGAFEYQLRHLRKQMKVLEDLASGKGRG
jgi:hypothetical protein